MTIDNGTHATLTVTLFNRGRGGTNVNKFFGRIEPNTKRAIWTDFAAGKDRMFEASLKLTVILEAKCVQPPLKPVRRSVRRQTLHQDIDVRISAGNFGRSFMADAPGCASCRKWEVTRAAAIYLHNVATLKPATVEECKEGCNAKEWCKSFDYNVIEGWCLLSDKTAADVGGLKTDYPNHPWNYYECKSEVARRGRVGSYSSYEITRNAAIYLENREELKPASLDRCKAACNVKDWCRSFDYNATEKWCFLSDKTAADVGGLKTDYPGHPWDYYERRPRR